MEVKLLEIRDRATFIPVLCMLMESHHSQESYLLGRAGYRPGFHLVRQVLMTSLNSPDKSDYDPSAWGNRTRETAHCWIADNWDDILTGDVIDVEFIRGETKEKKISERIA